MTRRWRVPKAEKPLKFGAKRRIFRQNGSAYGSLPEVGKGYGYFTKKSIDRDNTDSVGATGKGTLTQVFVDNSKDIEHVYIAVINTYTAKAVEDYDEKNDDVKLDVYRIYDLNDNGKNYVKKGPTAGPTYYDDCNYYRDDG